jgi:thioredoxin reductase (NADPH)
MDKTIYDIAIIGAGPTGIACAISAKKSGLSCVLLEKGLLVNSIFNFPTNMTFFSTSLKLEIGEIPFISNNDKPTRAEALEYYRRLAEFYELNIKYRTKALSLISNDHQYTIISSKGNFTSKNIIIATGYYDMPRLLGIPGEGLSKVKHYYDEAHHYIGQNVVVIGGANSACDVALETWSKGANVTMVIREPQLYQNVKYWILPNVENRIKEGSIKAYFNSEVTFISQSTVEIKTPNGVITLPNDYVLAMTGYKPDYEMLMKLGIAIKEDEMRTPYHDPETLETNLSNVYVAGVVNSGLGTSKLFIENTRHHGETIIKNILEKQNYLKHE